jgi:Fe-S cluster assembly protein SufD
MNLNHIQNNILLVKAGTSLSLMLADDTPLDLQVHVEQGARLDLVVLHQKSAVCKHAVALQKDSVLNLFYFTLSSDEAAQNLRVDLQGENAECNIFGLSVASLSQKIRTNFVVNHAVPSCRSAQLFKQVAAGNASVDFGGRVIVAKDAQHTDAQQTCRTLLLSETAHAHAQPQLEIYADDVKCSHGATVGQLDAESLFYLRSRGIGLVQAQQLLLLGFADEVVQKISSTEIRERVGQRVTERLSKLL